MFLLNILYHGWENKKGKDKGLHVCDMLIFFNWWLFDIPLNFLYQIFTTFVALKAFKFGPWIDFKSGSNSFLS